MPSVGFSFLILGLVVASAVGSETVIQSGENGTGESNGNDFTSVASTSTSTILPIQIITTTENSDTFNPTMTNPSMPNTTTDMSINTTIKPLTTTTKNKDSDVKSTPKPTGPSKSTSITTENNYAEKKPLSGSSNRAGIIILIVILVGIVVFGTACFFAKRRGRRYSIDPTSRPDEANIPLSTVDPDLPVDTISQNGLQTFESTEPATKEAQEPEAKAEVQVEQKSEAVKILDPSTESAAPSPSTDTSEDKPKEAVTEQSPPAPVESSVEEKTDDDDLVSNKTSVESLKEANENNSNNADLTARGSQVKSSNTFWDVPLDCPV